MKKKIGILLLIAIFGVVILKSLFNPYTKIARYVNHNEGNLRASCEFYLEQKYVNKADTEIDVMGIYGGEHKIVQFFYSGKGIAPAGVYYGFYYSPDDIPVPYCNGKEEYERYGTTGTITRLGFRDRGRKNEKSNITYSRKLLNHIRNFYSLSRLRNLVLDRLGSDRCLVFSLVISNT